jgi:hypothetical protein
VFISLLSAIPWWAILIMVDVMLRFKLCIIRIEGWRN